MTESGFHSTLRFIKKIPPSGAAPAYKLTLPHQVVSQHLQHFVKADFELASSAHTAQSWHGYISPRRNKDRAEFILQGWKLFAEAHKIQAGDHILFELSGPWRLVARLVQVPPSEVAFEHHTVPEVLCEMHVPKSKKTSLSSSPSRSNLQSATQKWSAVKGVAAEKPGPSPIPSVTNSKPLAPQSPTMAHRVQSWMSLSSKTEEGAAPSDTLIRNAGARQAESAICTPRPAEDDLLAIQPSPHGLDDLDCIFDDLEQFYSPFPDLPLASSPAYKEEHRLLKGFQVQERPREPTLKVPYAQVNHHGSHLPACSEAALKGFHHRLDESSRSALKAAVGLENTLAALCNVDDPCNRREVRAATDGFLSELKESLWKALVLANDMSA